MQAKKALSRYLCGYISVLCSIYVHVYVATWRLYFAHTVCKWLPCIAIPHLDIDITTRVVFLKSAAGYSVHKL